MKANRTYVPTSLQEQAAWFQNFKDGFAQVGITLGFLAADVTQVQHDNEDFQFCASSALTVTAYAKAVRQYRLTVTEGNIGDPAPQFPANIALTPPNQVPTGIFERLDNLVKRIRVAPNYTPEIGALLGIIPESPSRPAPEDMQPTLKVSTLPGSIVNVKFVRGGAVGVVIETKLDNSDTWTTAGQFQNSPAVITVPTNPENLPRSVQLRARYVEGNSPVGQFSPVVTTVTQPSV